MMTCVALVTCDAVPRLYEEEAEFPRQLGERGIDARVVSWSDPAVDWSRFDAIVFRSTWDYFERFDAFRGWLDALETAGAPLWNPAPLVRWNFDKRYLKELEGRGIPIVPTVLCEPGEPADLERLLRERNWTRAVIKPAVSGGAYRTHRLVASEAAALQPEMNAILATTGVLVQPFFPEIQEEGEWSLFFFEGVFSHAVLKTAVKGEYRIQMQFGGTARRVVPEGWMMEKARAVLAALPYPPAYARVDGLRRGSEFFLMEVELIEPYLFFGAAPEATHNYLELLERLARRVHA
jgi:hypothetical protein